MYAVILIRYRVSLEEVVAVTPAHRAYLADLHARGTVLASGPLEPRTGGAVLCRVPDDDPAALERIRDNDPYWQQGIADYEVLRWVPGIGAEGLDSL